MHNPHVQVLNLLFNNNYLFLNKTYIQPKKQFVDTTCMCPTSCGNTKRPRKTPYPDVQFSCDFGF